MIVIGQGRVGQALCALDPSGVHPIDRENGWEQLENEKAGRPIVVATRNDDLPAVLAKVPKSRHADLVLVQNGMLRPWLREAGLDGVTRGILFFAVPTRGAPAQSGGESPFWGPHAAALCTWMRAHGLAAREVSASEFATTELEKLSWNCVFGLLGQALELSVGELVQQQPQALKALSCELLQIGAKALNVEIDVAALCASMARYAQSIPSYRASVKEWRWRNGWFVQLQREAQCFAGSEHHKWLKRAGVELAR